jgi:CRISPR-associated protein Cmr1
VKTLKATFRIVTPMFLGGANPENIAELRAPSVKGILRFWWRVFETPMSVNNNTSKLAEIENRIFGGAGKNQGQSIFSLRITDIKEIKYGGKNNEKWDKTPVSYLGYGPIIRNKDIKKS